MNINKNNLSESTSPYLLQHKDNPVHWQEWSPELIAYAQEKNIPLIVSIGYAACHWCHVMEHESFENDEIAQVMNDHFICIKVDREERPDIDFIYMEAIQLLRGNGGWPLNAFAMPDGRPFMAGTYFPSHQWKDIVGKMSVAYETRYDEVAEQSRMITERIAHRSVINISDETDQKPKVLERYLYQSAEEILASHDLQNGGFKGAPKFPLPVAFKFLAQFKYKNQDTRVKNAISLTLRKMALGGIYDQIGGGFSRYAVDAKWMIPHFEKMLYDNAQLLELYAIAYKKDKNVLYHSVITDTITFLDRELKHEKGGYFASLNADSEGVEGKYYVWTASELKEVLSDEEYQLIKPFYNVTENGNWEKGVNILHSDISEEDYAAQSENPQDTKQAISEIRKNLLEKRETRIHPSLDDKIILSWNALLINGLVAASQACDNSDYLSKAIGISDFIWNHLGGENLNLLRSYKNKKASIIAFLDDYSIYINALLSLYEATLNIDHLTKAKELTDIVLKSFSDENIHPYFYYKSADDQILVAPQIEMQDSVIPSSNSYMALNLIKLSYLYDDHSYRERAQAMVLGVRDKIASHGPYYAQWAIAASLVYEEPYEVSILGPDSVKMAQSLQQSYLPNIIISGGTEEVLAIHKERLQEGKTMAYVCHNKTCQAPVNTISEILNLLK